MKKRSDCPLTEVQIWTYIVGTGLLCFMPYVMALLF